MWVPKKGRKSTVQHFLGDLLDVLCAEAELLQQGGGGAGVAEFIVDADTAEPGGALLAEQSGDGFAQTADDAVPHR